MYLQGNSRKNELYFARHIDFFLTQFVNQVGPSNHLEPPSNHVQNDLGNRAITMITELVRDNRKIVDRIPKSDMDAVIGLLKREWVGVAQQSTRALELLCRTTASSSFCRCCVCVTAWR